MKAKILSRFPSLLSFLFAVVLLSGCAGHETPSQPEPQTPTAQKDRPAVTKDKLPEKAFQVNNSYYVIQFLAKQEPPDEDFEKEKDQIIERLLQQKKFKTIENWLAEKRKSSEIIIDEKFIE